MNALKTKRTLLIGIGNDGRSDDALGWRFAETIESRYDCDVVYRYQLQIEDAELISNYDEVIFVDAHKALLPEGFSFYECLPACSPTFTTHSLSPETVLSLVHTIFNKIVKGYVLAISGEAWELKQGLSKNAATHLNRAIDFLTNQNLAATTIVNLAKPLHEKIT
jgi:hydrogenase maturation protease